MINQTYIDEYFEEWNNENIQELSEEELELWEQDELTIDEDQDEEF